MNRTTKYHPFISTQPESASKLSDLQHKLFPIPHLNISHSVNKSARTMKFITSDFTNPSRPHHAHSTSECIEDEAGGSNPIEGESSQPKEGHNESARGKANNEVKSKQKAGVEVEEECEVWPYFVENTFDRLSYGERKWLLFQLVCCQPVFLREVELGFPMSLVPDQSECEKMEGSDGINRDPQYEGVSKGKEKDVEPERHGPLMEIRLPKEEWLLTYCQIDAIPSSSQDEFLLNLFLMSPSYAYILSTFHSGLEAGKKIHDNRNDKIRRKQMRKWKKAFKERMVGRKVMARSAIGVAYGSLGIWEEMGKDREGVWDVALSEIGGWLMRSLPVPNELDQRPPLGTHPGQNEGEDKCEVICDQESEMWKVAQAHIEMMAFISETKILSLLQQITRPDSASDSFVGRYRYKVLAIQDLVNLGVLISQSPIPLRRLLGGVVESVSAEIVVLMCELEDADREWVKVDEDLAWGVECVRIGMEDVGLDDAWTGVLGVFGQDR
jgi:hypothetical protein